LHNGLHRVLVIDIKQVIDGGRDSSQIREGVVELIHVCVPAGLGVVQRYEGSRDDPEQLVTEPVDD
jgi:hypothetical protein